MNEYTVDLLSHLQPKKGMYIQLVLLTNTHNHTANFKKAELNISVIC